VSRSHFIRDVITRPFGKIVAAALAVLGTVATVREIALPEPTQAKLNFFRLWNLHWPWWLWTIVSLVAIVAILLEGAAAALRERDLTIANLRAVADQQMPHVFMGYEHMRRAPDPRDGMDSFSPVFLKNDGGETAMNIRVSRSSLGGKAVTFSPMATQLAPGETTTLAMYSAGRIDTRLDGRFAEIFHARLSTGQSEPSEERLEVNIEFTNRFGENFSTHFAVAGSVFPREEGAFQMEPLRIEVVRGSLPRTAG
jgi:hypothetical protein